MRRRWQVKIPPEISGVIRTLPPGQKRRLRNVLRHLETEPRDGKALLRELSGFLSYRSVPLRVIYRIEGAAVQVHAVGHRRTVYEEFTATLGISWSGGKPKGSPNPPRNRGKPVSRAIIEDRR